jgi:flagellar basal-body rod protein FlgG
MAITALHSASTGLSALSQELDIIAHNLSNSNTTGFKSFRANFENLLYQEKVQPGVETGNGEQRPAGLFVGLGTRIANTQANLEMGNPVPTEQDFDMMIEGQGYFQVQYTADGGTGTAYTRAGNFMRNRDGDLVLGNSDGVYLQPNINIPEGATDINIDSTGLVTYTLAGTTAEAGQIQLARFANPTGLKPISGNLYLETEASGNASIGEPADNGYGRILHKYLESSNVDPVKELVSLIKTQRAFEMNSQSIQAADSALETITNMRRF